MLSDTRTEPLADSGGMALSSGATIIKFSVATISTHQPQ